MTTDHKNQQNRRNDYHHILKTHETKHAQQTVNRFIDRYENKDGYKLLAQLCALPLVLTPELVNYLRNQFLREYKVPWVAEVDLLLSELCQPVGYELYAMDTPIRAYLLNTMRENSVLRPKMKEAAQLLIHYVRQLAHSNPFVGKHELQAQQWAAMVYLDEHRGEAAKEIAQSLKDSFAVPKVGSSLGKTVANTAELSRLSRIVATLKPELGKHKDLVDYAYYVSQILANPDEVDTEVLTTPRQVLGMEMPALVNLVGEEKRRQIGFKSQIDETKELIPYEIINRQSTPGIKLSFDIRVDYVDGRIPTEDELAAISNYLKETNPPHERIFVGIYMPGMVVGAGGFATAHHNPELEVKILRYPADEKTVSHFDSIEEMIIHFHDYHPENGTFVWRGGQPIPHFQLSRPVVENEREDVKEEYVKIAIIYGIFRTFIHTNLNDIIVTGIPLLMTTPGPGAATAERKYLSEYEKTILINRKTALELIQNMLHVETFADLVSSENYHGAVIHDQWSDKFMPCYYNNLGEPGLDRFFDALQQAAQIDNTKHARHLLNNTYILNELSTRPLLLDMIVKTLPTLRDKDQINAADLYKEYTGFWIDREDERSILTKDEKRQMMWDLAWQMYQKGEGGMASLYYSELNAENLAKVSNLRKVSAYDPEKLRYDLTTCSFLNRDKDGNYKFIHKSFMEYFLAEWLEHDFATFIKNPRLLNKEIYFFHRNLHPVEPPRLKIPLDLIYIPPGPFIYGGLEEPQKVVEIKEGYFIGKHPVTNEQFMEFIKAKGYHTKKYWSDDGWNFIQKEKINKPRFWDDEKWNQPLQPVVGINWYEADAFCRWLSGQLPTEEQWEKAARGLDGRTYPWGDEKPTEELANFDRKVGKTTPIGSYPLGASPYGLHDCAGNVWEWCENRFTERTDWRVLRGGSFSNGAHDLRAANRYGYYYYPVSRNSGVGFRVVPGFTL